MRWTRWADCLLARAACLLLMTPLIAYAQTTADSRLEITSVKRARREVPLQRPMDCRFPARGRFAAFGDLRYVLACACRIPPARARQQIVGGPRWIDEQLFQIDAVAAPEAVAALTVASGTFALDFRWRSDQAPSDAAGPAASRTPEVRSSARRSCVARHC